MRVARFEAQSSNKLCRKAFALFNYDEIQLFGLYRNHSFFEGVLIRLINLLGYVLRITYLFESQKEGSIPRNVYKKKIVRIVWWDLKQQNTVNCIYRGEAAADNFWQRFLSLTIS